MSERVTNEANLEATIIHPMMGLAAAAVFDAFTSPAHTRRWLPANGLELLRCDIDLRPGGRYQWQMGMAGKPVGPLVGGEYFQVIQGKRVIYSNDSGNKAPDAPKLIADLSFEDRDGGSTFTARIIFPSYEAMQAMVSSGGLEEVAAGNLRLEKYLNALKRA